MMLNIHRFTLPCFRKYGRCILKWQIYTKFNAFCILRLSSLRNVSYGEHCLCNKIRISADWPAWCCVLRTIYKNQKQCRDYQKTTKQLILHITWHEEKSPYCWNHSAITQQEMSYYYGFRYSSHLVRPNRNVSNDLCIVI